MKIARFIRKPKPKQDLSLSERRSLRKDAAAFHRIPGGDAVGYDIRFPNNTGVLMTCTVSGWSGYRMELMDGNFLPYRKAGKLKVYKNLSGHQFLQLCKHLKAL